MLSTGQLYSDPAGDFYARLDPDKAQTRALDQLRHLGYEVTLKIPTRIGVTNLRIRGPILRIVHDHQTVGSVNSGLAQKLVMLRCDPLIRCRTKPARSRAATTSALPQCGSGGTAADSEKRSALQRLSLLWALGHRSLLVMVGAPWMDLQSLLTEHLVSGAHPFQLFQVQAGGFDDRSDGLVSAIPAGSHLQLYALGGPLLPLWPSPERYFEMSGDPASGMIGPGNRIPSRKGRGQGVQLALDLGQPLRSGPGQDGEQPAKLIA